MPHLMLIALAVSCFPQPIGKPPADSEQAKPAKTAAAGSIQWRDSIDAAVADAKARGTYAMIYFENDWCRFCKRLEAECWSDAEVVGRMNAFSPARVKFDENRVLASRYRVAGHPTFLLLDGDGREADRFTGSAPPDEFAARLRLHRDYLFDMPVLLARLNGDPDDLDAAAGVAVIHAERGEFDQAGPLLERILKVESTGKDERLFRLLRAMEAHIDERDGAAARAAIQERATECAPGVEDEAAIRTDLGLTYVRLNRMEDAQAQFQSVLMMTDAPASLIERARSCLDRVARAKEKRESNRKESAEDRTQAEREAIERRNENEPPEPGDGENQDPP
jgi:thioredoxin-related protein